MYLLWNFGRGTRILWLHRPKEHKGWQVAFHMPQGSLLDTNRLVIPLSELLIQGGHDRTFSYMSGSALHIPSLR